MSPDPDRLPCATPGCRYTILPSTAAETGGYCQPCVQSVARERWHEHIRRNRRCVDPYQGVTDPVEIIATFHRRPPHDPLIAWLPWPGDIADVYRALTPEQAHRLVAQVQRGIDNGDDDVSDVMSCLAAFTRIDLDALHQALVRTGRLEQPAAFRTAAPAIRERLFAFVETEPELRNHALCGLAWIGDAEVVRRFHSWRARPPAWRAGLFIPPERYSREAAWDLSANGTRRDLFLGGSYALKRVPPGATAERVHEIGRASDSDCPWCASQLVVLLEIDRALLAGLGLAWPWATLSLITCMHCVAYVPIHFIVEAGGARWSDANAATEPPAKADAREAFVPVRVERAASLRPAHTAADWNLPIGFLQIGGMPTWLQDAEYPDCPRCKQPMICVAQVDGSQVHEHHEGFCYGFACAACCVTTTTYQQT